MHSEQIWDDKPAKVVRMRPDAARRQGTAMDAEAPRTQVKVRAQLGLGDIVTLWLRELWLVGLVFCVIFGIGAAVALSMPSTYTANASLLMQLGQDYVYVPPAGDAARGATATIDEVVQSETEILNSTELKKRVIDKVGYKVVLPKSPQYWNPRTDADRARADAAALKVLQAGFSAGAAPQNNVVRLSFKHEDAMSASLILNTLIDEYQTYRREVFADATGPLLQKEKAAFDQRLAVADQAYQDFLAQNGVGDFTAAKATYAKVYDQVTGDLYTAQAQMAQDRAKLSEITASLKALSPEMSVERDLDLSVPSRILALQQQRQELLSRYLPAAQPVKDLDAQIASLQAMMASGSGVGEKDHKMGVNPVYQGLITQKFDVEADLASLNGRVAQLQAQATEVTRKLQGLGGIEARYNDLSSERDSLQSNIKSFTQRIQENDASREIAKGEDDSVRVVEKATMPDKPKSLKRPILIMAFLFAAFTAGCAGLARVFLRKGFQSAEMAAKTLDLPLLAKAGIKPDSQAA